MRLLAESAAHGEGFISTDFGAVPPQPPYFDEKLNGWVLSRYADVLAALQDGRLCPVDSRAEDIPAREELDDKRRSRSATLTALSGREVRSLEAPFRQLAQTTMTALRSSQRIDVVRQFAEPWCLAVSMTIIGAKEEDRERLDRLAREVSMATADPSSEHLREPAKAAGEQLADILRFSPIPMSGPAFVGLSQSLPCFLANAWLALLRHPEQLDLLRQQTSLMPAAIEELFRYAGVAHTVIRRASAPLHLAGVTIAQKDRVILKLPSANRDPQQFTEPDRLDISRRALPHLGLGAAFHSCAAASVIRMLAGIATSTFVEHAPVLDDTMSIEWQGGSGFRSPKSLYVFFRADN
jgi:cytochrome P450